MTHLEIWSVLSVISYVRKVSVIKKLKLVFCHKNSDSNCDVLNGEENMFKPCFHFKKLVLYVTIFRKNKQVEGLGNYYNNYKRGEGESALLREWPTSNDCC